jgi:hypothetical protein
MLAYPSLVVAQIIYQSQIVQIPLMAFVYAALRRMTGHHEQT